MYDYWSSAFSFARGGHLLYMEMPGFQFYSSTVTLLVNIFIWVGHVPDGNHAQPASHSQKSKQCQFKFRLADDLPLRPLEIFIDLLGNRCSIQQISVSKCCLLESGLFAHWQEKNDLGHLVLFSNVSRYQRQVFNYHKCTVSGFSFNALPTWTMVIRNSSHMKVHDRC